jgi:hypothetical protein
LDRAEFGNLNVRKSTMSSQDIGEGKDSTFSFGVRELREAREAQHRRAATSPQAPQLAAPMPPAKSRRESHGFDPYNTSGSFDRAANWARVGKR